MKQERIDLARRVKERIDFFLTDQQQSSPRFRSEEVPGELHGYLAGLLFRDREEDELFLDLLIGLLLSTDQPSKDDIVRTLSSISKSLAGIRGVSE